MTHGWTGKILEIDLERGEHAVIRPDPETYASYIGGKGLAGHYLSPHVTLPYDDPEMPLLLFTGPLVGTAAPTSGRSTLMSRSPLTGAVCDASVGGALGTQLKRAGLDGIIVRGRAARWTGIAITDDAVELVDASELLGLTLSAAATRLGGSGSVAMIGPAAEAGVRFASVMVDRHFTAGRGGLGLVFAAKRLKFITVKGSGRAAVRYPEELARAREDIRRLVAASPILLGESGIANNGTPALYDLMHARRMMPTANFSRTRFEAAERLNSHALASAFEPRKAGCKGCHIQCKKRDRDGEHLPEFETLSHFTALLGNDDLDVVAAANSKCNDLGMDTISCAVTLACHAELSGEEIGGAEILALIDGMVSGDGPGVELKDGSLRYARRKGSPELSMSVKGLELPAYDPRGAYGMALAYATSTRGGCHLRAYPLSHEILRKPVVTDRFSFDGKARIIKIAEDMNAVIDSLTACKFVFFSATLEEYAHAFRAVTGVDASANELSRAGERIYYHERMMNSRLGFGVADDDLPRRFFEEGGTSGPSFDVPPIDRSAFLDCRSKYYRIRGLDEDGAPSRARAKELGLPWRD